MLNLSIILEDSARRHGGRPSFTVGDTTYTYEQINREANRIANAIRGLGILPGEKIAICIPNLPEFPMVYFGILKAGAVVVTLSVLFKKDEFAYHLRDSDTSLFICAAGTPEMPMGKYGREAFEACPDCRHFYLIPGNELVPGTEGASTLEDLTRGIGDGGETYPTSAEDTAVIVYTSGTTGFAKGAELSHSNLLTNAMLTIDILRSCEDDVQLVVLPLFHIFGMTVMMNAGIYKGLHSILLPKFDAGETFRLIERHRVSIFAGVPTMYWSLLDHSADKFDHSSIAGRLRVCISGGASLPLELLKAFEERFQAPILEGYGMSEGAPVVTFNYMQTGRKPGSVGVPVWGVEVKLVDKSGVEVPPGEKGELLFRGPNVMKGYYKRAAETNIVLKDGWLHSGDLAVKDEDGFYFIVDRIKDMIIRGGMKVYPREVEEVLMQHPSVSIAAVIGITHEKWGEEVKAFIVLKKGHSVSAASIIAWVKDRMAAYKYPRLIEFIDKLPVSASGKILKRVLRLQSNS